MKEALPKIILSVCLLLVGGFLALYLYQAGDLTRQGYLVKEQQKARQAGLTEKVNIEKLLVQNTLENREEQIRKLGFVAVEQVKFIPVSAAYLTRSNP